MIERIIQIRERSGLSQEKFAERLGLSRNFINQVENGKKNISKRTIEDICEEFEINESWLKTGIGDMERKFDVEFGEICADIGLNDPRAREAIRYNYKLSEEDKELWWKRSEKFLK